MSSKRPFGLPALTGRVATAALGAAALVTGGLIAVAPSVAAATQAAGTQSSSTQSSSTQGSASHGSGTHSSGAPSSATQAANTQRLCAQPAKAGMMSCLALARTDVQHHLGISPNALPSGYGPSDLQSAYALPANAGAGTTVAIVDAQDDPSAESDLATYRSQYGLPACTTANGCFKKADQNGGTNYPTADSGWAGEISLDVDMVSAVCPQCHILLVEANSASMDDLGTAVNRAVTMGAKYVSNSYGGSEDSTDPSSDSSYFNHPGVAITVSSGDSGYGVEYPAASQYVTSVGGTSLSRASNTRGWSESVWGTSSGGEGAGSGCSAYDPKPSWQHDTGCAKRTVADVSAVADPNTGLAVYDSYQASGWNVYGGTSASSPIIASVYALAGTPAANTVPASYPYAHTSSLNDVTSGANGSCSPAYLCTAAAGYDGPTGLGTPNGTAAFTGGTSTGNTVTVTNPGNQSTQVNTAASLQIHATDSGSGQTLTYSATGLPAGLSINASTGLISGTPTTAGSYNVTVTAKDSTNASGSTSFTWTVTTSGGGGCTAAQLLGNPGFETGSASPWSATAGVVDNSSGEPAHSGSWKAWLNGYGTTHTDSLSQTVTIPAGCHATLSYYLHIDTKETTTTVAYDKLTVTAGSTTLASYSNLNKNTGFAQKSFDLSSFAGQTVTLKFNGTEDSSLATSFVIDDTAVNVS
ncbi:putative Ig domain-containing protein [Streptomyces sp. NPDC048361]|uniref:putative Ig domain-containing protein n=1 Tax=Streptomyces sp. NPDC048361 TaxID=3154720 RepID=UPI0034199D7C